MTPQIEEVPQTMKAQICQAHDGRVKFCEVPTPKPGIGECLVKIVKSGICHTDIHACMGDWDIKSKLPLVPGHEGAGVVVALGPEVNAVKIGDRVGIAWLYQACGSCEYCEDGWETLCDQVKNAGFSVDGSYSEYAIADAKYVAKIPEKLSFEQACPILCAGVTTYKGLKVSDVKAGEWVVINGAGGGLGHVAVQYAKAMGMKVIGLDVGDDKLDFIRSLGADYALDPLKDANVVEKVKEITRGGAHGILCLAASLAAYKAAESMCRKNGTIVSIALPKGDIPINTVNMVVNAITFKGSIVGTRKDMQEALEIAADGKVVCKTELVGLKDVNGCFDRLLKGNVNGRLVIDMVDESGTDSYVEMM